MIKELVTVYLSTTHFLICCRCPPYLQSISHLKLLSRSDSLTYTQIRICANMFLSKISTDTFIYTTSRKFF